MTRLSSAAARRTAEEARVSLEGKIEQLERSIDHIAPVMQLTRNIISELLMSTHAAPSSEPEKIGKILGAARNLIKVGEETTARELLQQAEEAVELAQHWLTVADFGISAYILRTYMERHPISREQMEAFIRYYLAKTPHALNDQDKLDYILLEYFAEKIIMTGQANPQILLEIEDLLEPLGPDRDLPEPGDDVESMLAELYELRGLLSEFSDFDRLIQSRVVERARAIKVNLRDFFFHPSVLPRVIHFNLDFRYHFQILFEAQLAGVRKATRSRVEEAWELLRLIQEEYEQMEVPEAQRQGAGMPENLNGTSDLIVGRALESEAERIPLDRLRRGDTELRKDADLQGILKRIAKFVKAVPSTLAGKDAELPLRRARLTLSFVEREAFQPSDGNPPVTAGTLQLGLGLIAWLEEELAAYEETRNDRYQWKPHFDLLSHAVARSVGLMHTVRALLHDEAPQEEAAWFEPLVNVSLRLGQTLNKLLPVFEDPEKG